MNQAVAFSRGLLRRGPVYALVQITARCNQRCRMCRVWTLERGQAQELSLERYLEMARIFRSAGIQVVTLGGEPFLREDLPEVVAAFARQGMSVRIQTNGTLVDDESMKAALEAGLSGISVSLHSLDPALMDRMSGVEGTLDAVLAGMDAISRQASGRRRFLQIVNMVLHAGNLDEVPAMLAACSDRGFRLSVIPIHVAPLREDEKQFVEALPPGFAVGEADAPRVEAAVDHLLKARRAGRTVLNSSRFLGMVPEFLAGSMPAWPCLAGTLYVFVDHAGLVAPCHDLDPMGSIFEPSMVESLRAGNLGWRASSERGACPGCLLPCWSELSLMFSSPSAFLEAVEVNLPRIRRARP